MADERLKQFLIDATNRVPYYQRVGPPISLAQQLSGNELLQRYPLLDKSTIRLNWNDIRDFSRDVYVTNTSGGSTGEPIIIEQDREYYVNSSTDYFNELAGYEIGDKAVWLWGSERDLIQGSYGIKNVLLNVFVNRIRFLNSFKLNERQMRSFVSTINHYKPRFMVAYVQSAFELARFVEQQGLRVRPLEAVICSAGTLYATHREVIEKVFGCKVHNRYGSREVGAIAMECCTHDAMHTNPFGNVIEILDDTGQEVGDGEEGEIVVTNLTNRRMPLIRYRIGDRGVRQNKACSCGRSTPVIKRISGRTVELFRTVDGSQIDGEFFTHLLYFVKGVARFQVIQEKIDRIRIIIQPDSNFRLPLNFEKNTTKSIKKAMGDRVCVEYSYVSEIPSLSSGKYVYTISRID